MVFCGLFPVETNQFPDLRDALEKLELNDAALTWEPETSEALGFGFRCGFLGLLHMDIVRERLEREYDLELLATTPTVEYDVTLTDGREVVVHSPSDMPDRAEIAAIEEPYIRATILTPKEHVGAVMELCQERRGTHVDMTFLSQERVQLHYDLPLAEIVLDFFDQLKSRTKGYASLDYELIGMREGDLVKLDILLSGDKVDALSMVVHRDKAYPAGPRSHRAPAQADPAPAVRGGDPGGDRREDHRPRVGEADAQGRDRQVLRRRRQPQAQAAREAEGRQEAHEAGGPRGGAAGGFPGGARAVGGRRRLIVLVHSGIAEPGDVGRLRAAGRGAAAFRSPKPLSAEAPVALVGASYGGLVCLDFAARHPELVTELVLLDCPAAGPRLVGRGHRVRGGGGAAARSRRPRRGDRAEPRLLGAERGRPPAPDDALVARARDRRDRGGGPRRRARPDARGGGRARQGGLPRDRRAARARDPGRRGGGDRRRGTSSVARAARRRRPGSSETFLGCRVAWVTFPRLAGALVVLAVALAPGASAQTSYPPCPPGTPTPTFTVNGTAGPVYTTHDLLVRVKQPGDPDFSTHELRGVRRPPAPARGRGRGRARSPPSADSPGTLSAERNAAHRGERRQHVAR